MDNLKYLSNDVRAIWEGMQAVQRKVRKDSQDPALLASRQRLNKSIQEGSSGLLDLATNTHQALVDPRAFLNQKKGELTQTVIEPSDTTPHESHKARKKRKAASRRKYLDSKKDTSSSDSDNDAGNGGGDQTPPPRPPRADVTPIAGNVEDAYSLFKNDYSGNGFNTGQLSSEGFVDWSDKDNWDTASKWSDGLNLGAGYGKVSDNLSNLDKFSNYDENQAAAFTTDAPQIVKPAASGGLAGLRVDEKEAGVVYASGAYWMDGADGKLEKIMDPDTAGWTANRTQALEIARNRLKTGGDTGKSVSETASEPVKVADPAAKPFQGVSLATNNSNQGQSLTDGQLLSQINKNTENSVPTEMQLYDEHGPTGLVTGRKFGSKPPVKPFQGASSSTDKVDTTDSAGLVKRGEAAGLWTNPENIDKDGNLKYEENRFYAPPGALF